MAGQVERVTGIRSGVMLAQREPLQRSRWDGPLDDEALAHCRERGVAVGYDPAQIGWVVVDDEIARGADLAGLGTAPTDSIGTTGEADVSDADRRHWAQLHRSDGAPRAAALVAPTRDVAFRPWTTADVAAHRSLLDDAAVWEHLPEPFPTPYTDATSAALIELANALAGHDVVAIEIDGVLVGQCLLRIDGRDRDPTVGEVAYWLGRAHWGRGLMTHILPAFLHRCFADDRLDLVHAWIHPDNVASVRVAERAGFRRDRFEREAELAAATGRAGFGRWVLGRPR